MFFRDLEEDLEFNHLTSMIFWLLKKADMDQFWIRSFFTNKKFKYDD